MLLLRLICHSSFLAKLAPDGCGCNFIKQIKAEGSAGGGLVKVILNGNSEIEKIDISEKIFSEDKTMLEDLIVAAHNEAKKNLKTKTTEEITKATGNFGIPGFKWPF